MGVVDDRRGVSNIIGALFVAFFLVVSLATYQAAVVPQQNEEAEFEHYQDVQDDMVGVGSETVSAAGRNVTGSATVDLGTSYRSRTFTLNPPPATGTLAKRAEGDISITPASGSLDAADLCGGGTGTFGIAYTPDYNELDADEIVYENGQVYVNASSDALLDDRTVVDTASNTIDIYRLDGSLPTESGTGSVSVDLEGSTIIGRNTTEVDSVQFPSELSVEKWRTDVVDTSDTDVSESDVTASGDGVKVEFPSAEQSEEYTIRCYTVGIDERPPTNFGGGFGTNLASTGTNSNSGNGSGVGLGGVSTYSSSDPEETFSTNNGLWTGISCTDRINLEDGEPASRPNGDNLQGDVVRIQFALNDSSSATANYTLDVRLANKTDDSGWNKKKVYVYEDGANSKSNELTGAAASAIYEGGTTDVVDANSYKSPGSDFTSRLADVRGLEDNAPVRWQTARMLGRVDVELACGAPVNFPRVVFVDSSNGDLKAIDSDDDIETFQTEQVSALGPMREDVDGDGSKDLPYVNSSQELRIVSDDDGKVTLDGSGNVKKIHLGVGDWDDTGDTDVVYVRNGRLYNWSDGQGTNEICRSFAGGSGNCGSAGSLPSDHYPAKSVAGVADFDGDGNRDIVYINDSSEVLYLDQPTDSPTQLSTPVTVGSAKAIGRPADYDDDTEPEVPFYNDSGGLSKGITLVDKDGLDGSFDPSPQVKQASMGAFDYVGDDTPEIIFIDNNNNLKYLNPDDGSTGDVGSEKAKENPGVG